MADHTVLLLQAGIQQIELLAVLGIDFRQTLIFRKPRDSYLLKDVTSTLQLAALVAGDELVHVLQPDLATVGEGEDGHALLIHAEGLFVAVVLLQVRSIIEDILRMTADSSPYLRRDDL